MQCKLCGGEDIELKYLITRLKPPLTIYRCRECGFQFQDLNSSQAYRFYQEGYYTGENEFSYQDERVNKKASAEVWRARLSRLKKRDRSNGVPRYLDVGCSFGGMMEVAQEFGYVAYGVEVSSYSGGYAMQNFGNERIFIGAIEEITLPENYFSVVTLIEVIEHILNPRQALNNIYRAMKPGGVVLIQTADMDGLQARLQGKNYHYYLPGHISYFDRYNLRWLLKNVGFKKVSYIGGVEFGLVPKLKKSAANFKNWYEYFKWLRIVGYHFLSKITLGRIHLTSSMVMLAWK